MKQIKNNPKKLYYKGNIDLLNSNIIAIIGSRANSLYGEQLAKKFAKELVRQNITIVSGMAIGIDTIAHKAVLEEKGNTIAVLPCGFNYIFPEENRELFNDIINNNGLVLSEYPPNEKANSSKFLERNRIVSGLSIGILIIESAFRSGTSVTARLAIEQNRKIFVPPHELGDKNGVGINKLLKNGAILITETKDIIDNYKFLEYKQIKEEKINYRQEIEDYKKIEYRKEIKNNKTIKYGKEIKDSKTIKYEKEIKNNEKIAIDYQKSKKRTQKNSKILQNNIKIQSNSDKNKQLQPDKNIQLNKVKKPLSLENIEKSERENFNKIYDLIENIPITIDEIQIKTNMHINKINNYLFNLEIEGYIKKVAGGGYICD